MVERLDTSDSKSDSKQKHSSLAQKNAWRQEVVAKRLFSLQTIRFLLFIEDNIERSFPSESQDQR